MSKTYQIGILGCGDFLRWQADGLKDSAHVVVKSLFDPDKSRAEKFAADLGGAAVDTEEAIFNDPEIDIVLLFVPPWIRRGQIEKAAAAGKHILTTKPLGPNNEDCVAMVAAVEAASVRCGVMYSRTGDSQIESLKSLFDSGKIGALALYKQDWLHHYPQWNSWALDPEKNGGPFMDAMIHNLNAARYLMGRGSTSATFFGSALAHELACNDTESMHVEFSSGGVAELFITWAADLNVESTEGNFREHIDLFYMVTDQGYRVTLDSDEAGPAIFASKDGQTQRFGVSELDGTVFDRFADAIETHGELPGDIVDIQMSADDIQIVRNTAGNQGKPTALNC